jgi:HAD superfamily hydrolase (TIGR01509 family)
MTPGSIEGLGTGTCSNAKPEPDLFLACAGQLGIAAEECYAVGDAPWDLLAARRARMLSIGLLSGDSGEDG